jgi:hypothetical protein
MFDNALTDRCYVEFVTDKTAEPPSPFRAQWVAYFEVVDSRAQEVSEPDFYTEHRGQFQVWLTLAAIHNRMRCVGVDIRSYKRPVFEETLADRVALEPFDGRDGLAAMDSAVWRSIPIGDLIQRAIEEKKAYFLARAEQARRDDQEETARRYESLVGEPGKPRHGPRRSLSLEDLTTVVAPAYDAGGRKPVVAVREALSKHRGVPVSIDTARKAVVRAREVGALPPAGGRGKLS